MKGSRGSLDKDLTVINKGNRQDRDMLYEQNENTKKETTTRNNNERENP